MLCISLKKLCDHEIQVNKQFNQFRIQDGGARRSEPKVGVEWQHQQRPKIAKKNSKFDEKIMIKLKLNLKSLKF